MKSYYIYMVTIHHPKGDVYYVGSHTWEGPEGVLDPNYHGSCAYRYYKRWLSLYPYDEVILEVSNRDEVYEAERRWILKVLNEKGSYLKGHNTKGKNWLDQFKRGRCLNANALRGESLRSEEALKNLSKWRSEHSEEVSNIVHNARVRMGEERLKEASKKAMDTMGELGLKKRTQTRLINMGTDGCSVLCKHAAQTRGDSYKESSFKGVTTRSGTKTVYRKVYLNGVEFPTIVDACKSIGHRNWNSMVSQHFCKGETVVVRVDKGVAYEFKIAGVVKEVIYGK